MRRAASRTVLLAAVGLGALGASPSPSPLTYRFDEVKSKVLRSPGGDEKKEVRVAQGETATGGDAVRTGFWGRAVLSVPERKARFSIGSSTRVKLGAAEAEVLLTIEKGRIEAFFDALVGEPPVERRVAAPGALLAVRGTRYGVEVSGEGEALVAVFEGTVEVIPTRPGLAPVRVPARSYCTFSPRGEPRPAPMEGTGMSERSWGRRDVPPPPRGDGRPGAPETQPPPGSPGSQPPGGTAPPPPPGGQQPRPPAPGGPHAP